MTEEEIRQIGLRLPAYLHEFARDEAYRQRVSLNAYITSLIKKGFEHREYLQSPEYLERQEQLEKKIAKQQQIVEEALGRLNQMLKQIDESLEHNEKMKQPFEEKMIKQKAEKPEKK